MYEINLEYEFKRVDLQSEKLRDFDKLARLATTPSMKQSVLTTEGKVRPLIPVGVSGEHRRGVTSEVKTGIGSVLVTGRVGSKIKGPSMSTLETGRKPGSQAPPASALIRWVILKLGVSPDKAKGVAFVVARNIGRVGFKTWPKGVRAYAKGYRASIVAVRKFHRQGLERLLKMMKV